MFFWSQNLTNIESSQLVQNLKVNQQFCFICEEPNIELEPGKPAKNQNILIYPCLCNRMAHRECMKKYLAHTQEFGCETCKANYAIGRSSTKALAHITPNVITSWLAKAFVSFAFIVAMILIMIYISSFENEADLVKNWRVVLIVLFGIIMGLSVIYIIVTIRDTIKKLSRSDIEIYCNQTEIGLHTKNAKEILRDFFENTAHLSLTESLHNSHQVHDEGEEMDENSRRSVHTNASIIKNKEEEKRKEYSQERDIHEMEKILNKRNNKDYGTASQRKFVRENLEFVQIPLSQKASQNGYHPPGNYKKGGLAERIEKDEHNHKRFAVDAIHIDEMSSIKGDIKSPAVDDSFRAFTNIIKANLHSAGIKRTASDKNTHGIYDEENPVKSTQQTKKSKSYKDSPEVVEQKPLPSSENELNKTVPQYEDIEVNHSPNNNRNNNDVRQDKEANNLTLNLTSHSPTI